MRRSAARWGVAALLCLGGCALPSPELEFDEAEGVVRAELPESLTRRLESAAADADGRLTVSEILHVQVVSAGDEASVAMHGSADFARGELVFTPSFPFAAGVGYRASFDGAAFVERFGGLPPSSAELDFRPAVDRVSSTPRVVALYPSGDELPQNLLRMYLHFSEPMRQGVAWDHLRLEDAGGRVLELGLLELDHELWDPSGTRLTLLFDPGRLKSGLLPNREEGRPLDGQSTIAFVVDGSWHSAEGTPLGTEHRVVYAVGPPDHTQPRPAEWSLLPPGLDSREPLEIELDGPLDHGMLERSLVVLREGESIAVRASATRGERAVLLTPEEPWAAGSYIVQINSRLEDPSGNSVRRPFETRLTEEPQSPGETQPARLSFVLVDEG
ncbi:MAG: hypothetical protein AAGA81_20995 [Acidobacteriota bacterium]